MFCYHLLYLLIFTMELFQVFKYTPKGGLAIEASSQNPFLDTYYYRTQCCFVCLFYGRSNYVLQCTYEEIAICRIRKREYFCHCLVEVNFGEEKSLLSFPFKVLSDLNRLTALGNVGSEDKISDDSII